MVQMNLDINKFFVKQFYTVLELRVVISFLTQLVWNSWVLYRVNFFAWEASWGKNLTLDQLQKQGGLQSIGIFFVKKMKNPQITFFFIIYRLRFSGSSCLIFLVSIGCNLLQLRRLYQGGMVHLWAKKEKKFGEQLYYVFFWTIQKGRNLRAFDNEERFAFFFLHIFFLRNLFFQVKQQLEIVSLSFFDFIEWLGFG